MTEKVKRKLNGAASKMLTTHPGRSPKSYYKRSDEGAGQKMELAGTRPTHARAPPGAQSPVKLRQTYPRDAFRKHTKSKYRERYKKCLRIGSCGVAIGPYCVANLYHIRGSCNKVSTGPVTVSKILCQAKMAAVI